MEKLTTLRMRDGTVERDFEVGTLVEIDNPRKLLLIEEQADGKLWVTISKALGLDALTLARIELVRVHVPDPEPEPEVEVEPEPA